MCDLKGRTGRTQQTGTWWLFQVQVTRRGLSPGNVTTIFRPGWHEETKADVNAWLCGPLWWDTMGRSSRGTWGPAGRTSSKSNHQSEVVTDPLWHPFIMQISEPSFLYHQKHSLWEKKLLCLQEKNSTLNWIVAMETMWESLLNGMWEAEVYAYT